MGVQRLGAAFVGDVPNTKGFIVGRGKKELSSWVNQEGSHPIVVTGQREQTNTWMNRKNKANVYKIINTKKGYQSIYLS